MIFKIRRINSHSHYIYISPKKKGISRSHNAGVDNGW